MNRDYNFYVVIMVLLAIFFAYTSLRAARTDDNFTIFKQDFSTNKGGLK